MGCSSDHFSLCPWDHLRSCLCLWEGIFVHCSLFLGLKLHVRAIFSIFSVSLTLWSSAALWSCDNHPAQGRAWLGQQPQDAQGAIFVHHILLQDANLTHRSCWTLGGEVLEVFREQQEELFVFHPTWCFRCLRHRAVSLMSSQLLSGITAVLCHSWSKSLCLQEKWSGSQLNNSKNPTRSASKSKKLAVALGHAVRTRRSLWAPSGG